MPRQAKQVTIGKEYGWLTVLSRAPKDKTGHIRWNVRCRCGKEYMVQTAFLFKPNCKCRDCSDKTDRANRRLSTVGDVINGWRILEEVGKNSHGAILYLCECTHCGYTTIKTRGAISSVKGNMCVNCIPDYHFVIRDLDLLTIGLVLDMWTEKANDDVKYDRVAGQEDFDKF